MEVGMQTVKVGTMKEAGTMKVLYIVYIVYIVYIYSVYIVYIIHIVYIYIYMEVGMQTVKVVGTMKEAGMMVVVGMARDGPSRHRPRGRSWRRPRRSPSRPSSGRLTF